MVTASSSGKSTIRTSVRHCLTPRESPEGAPVPNLLADAGGQTQEEAPLVSPVGRPRARRRPLRAVSSSYDPCVVCGHWRVTHMTRGGCAVLGCDCPSTKYESGMFWRAG